jgi:xylulokinase
MSGYIIAYDLGTGGVKATLFSPAGDCLAEASCPYDTFYQQAGWHEQRPEDWWTAVVHSTRKMLAGINIDPGQIEAMGISGHSLGVVPLDARGRLLRVQTPIWSDARSTAQARRMFEQVSEKEWYFLTGNGFPPAHYSVFKIMWYRDHEPDLYHQIHMVIGTKDYINFKLTGRMLTDHSYASGSGVYDLAHWQYSEKLIEASGLPAEIFPDICPSTEVIGTLNKDAAEELGLPRKIQLVTGGVDNSCMAVGARNIRDGTVYNNQGSSSGIAITSSEPILDDKFRPFIFTAVIPGLFNSAVPVFSAGTSFRWVRDHFCLDLIEQAQQEGWDVYDLMTSEAAGSPVGSRGVIFHPNLAGGSSIDPSPDMRGAFLGLDLGHSRADILRAAMEGIALELGIAVNKFRIKYPMGDEVVVAGGGSRSKLWRQIYADVYQMRIIKTNIDQQAAALGAAAVAAVGTGIWTDFERIEEIHQVMDVTEPDPSNVAVYEKIMLAFMLAGKYLSELKDFQEEVNP